MAGSSAWPSGSRTSLPGPVGTASIWRISTSDPRPGATESAAPYWPTLATIARREGYARLDWSVLDWNSSAIRFYRSVGAVPMDEWTGYRLSGAALTALGSAIGEAPA